MFFRRNMTFVSNEDVEFIQVGYEFLLFEGAASFSGGGMIKKNQKPQWELTLLHCINYPIMLLSRLNSGTSFSRWPFLTLHSNEDVLSLAFSRALCTNLHSSLPLASVLNPLPTHLHPQKMRRTRTTSCYAPGVLSTWLSSQSPESVSWAALNFKTTNWLWKCLLPLLT